MVTDLDSLVIQPEPLKLNGEVYNVKTEIYFPATRLKYAALAQAVEEAKDENEKLDKNIEMLEFLESFIDTDSKLLTGALVHPRLLKVRIAIVRRLLADINGEDINAAPAEKTEESKKK